MKVNIGPYLNWVGPYQLADLLQYIGVSEDKCHDIGKVLPEWVNATCEWIYSKRHRKIKVKIDDYDVWSLDSTLAYIIIPALNKIKDDKHGTPLLDVYSQTSESSQGSFDFYANDDYMASDENSRQWQEILDKMIWAFEQINEDWEDQYTIVNPEIDFTKYPEDEGKMVVPLRWKVKGEIDWEGRLQHMKKIEEGLALFGEYYQTLWT